eukprot:1930523-Rhodomonas_salina.1
MTQIQEITRAESPVIEPVQSVRECFTGLHTLLGKLAAEPLRHMYAEHNFRAGFDEEFCPAGATTMTSAKQEWNSVVGPDGMREGDSEIALNKAIPVLKGARAAHLKLELFAACSEFSMAKLSIAELVALRLCCGPMLEQYNAVLRSCNTANEDDVSVAPRDARFATTIQVAVSGVLKLSALPHNQCRSAFCPARNFALPPGAWTPDANGFVGGLEKG